MLTPNPPASTGPSPEKPPEPPPARQQAGSTPGARKLIRTRPARLIALVLVTVAVSCVAGAFLFQATGSRRGYQTGYASVGYYESAAIADSMIADASNSTLRLAGLAPETGQHGAWYVARFELARAGKLCRYGATPVPDSVRVPTFSALARVPTGKSYNSGYDGGTHHVNR